jgi:4-hydroxy-3-polyprenylbenzoate decarboxylase
MELIVAVTGASGAVYSKRLLEFLRERRIKVHLIISDSARLIIEHELGGQDALDDLSSIQYKPTDLTAPVSSGSYKVDGMIIVPASMKTIGGIASGYCEDLITRAADVQLKQRRPLVIVPRETPLHAIHLENMAKLSLLGATILPAMPAFYHEPRTIGDLVDFVVGKILDQLGIDHGLYRRWGTA